MTTYFPSEINPETQALAQQMAVSLGRVQSLNEAGDSPPTELLHLCAWLLDALHQGEIALALSQLPREILPSSEDWKDWLLQSGLATTAPTESTDNESRLPFIVQDDHCYFGRYFYYQRHLQHQLGVLAEPSSLLSGNPNALEIAKAELQRLFAASSDSASADQTEINWQQVAAATALLQRLCVISGGPGTGKTTTVIRLLAALLATQQRLGLPPLRIGLAAPTGKAAARMEESIRKQMATLDTDETLKKQLGLSASTLHRLLGFIPNSSRFRHHADNPLPLDVLIVDESSMIDTVMMAKVLDALPAQARLILLGDKDQLPPVEAGSPFADMCAAMGFSSDFADRVSALLPQSLPAEAMASPTSALGDHIVMLHHSYRFGADSPIGRLACCVNQGDYQQAIAEMKAPDMDSAQHPPVNATKGQAAIWRSYQGADYSGFQAGKTAQAVRESNPLRQVLSEAWQDYKYALLQPLTIEPHEQLTSLFADFQRFCLLTAVHQGVHGREAMNRLAEESLGFPRDKRWYHGRPIMVSRNDYQTGLYNGDVGICLQNNEGELRVYFPQTQGFMDVMPSRVPAHDTAFAITVHKSQGSEFDRVLFLLPSSPSRILTKALAYTAITRAKRVIEVWGAEAVWDSVE